VEYVLLGEISSTRLRGKTIGCFWHSKFGLNALHD
jgi:hypothetical protein